MSETDARSSNVCRFVLQPPPTWIYDRLSYSYVKALSTVPMRRSQATQPEEIRYRENVLRVLRLLASREAQLDYQQRVPNADVSAEQFCQWADDTFFSGDPRLQALFSKEEWGVLLEFDARFESIAARAPEPLPAITEFVDLPSRP